MNYFKLTFLTLLVFSSVLVAQQPKYTVESRKAIMKYEEGRTNLAYGNALQAKESLLAAIKKEPEFIEAIIVYAEACSALGEYEESLQNYRRALKIDSSFFIGVFLNVARIEFKLGNFNEVIRNISIYLASDQLRQSSRHEAQKLLRDAIFSNSIEYEPIVVQPELLSDSINSEYYEYWPSVTADEKTMIFTARLPYEYAENMFTSQLQEDFYVSFFEDGAWQKRERLGDFLNTPGNEGAQSITADGSTMFFTACNRPDGIGKCDIYVTFWNGETWIEPMNVGKPVNSIYWESQPSISADGKTLYFASNRPGGKGGLDIWKSVLDKNGKWTVPENLGEPINTKENEQSPFIHFDNTTLYFSSEGHPGMGKSDIFLSRKTDSLWSEPINLGYPINSKEDDVGLIVNAKSNKAYFSSARISERYNDIYQFELPEKVRPTPVSYLAGKVYNKLTGDPVFAEFELIDLGTGDLVMNAASNSYTGDYLVCLPMKKQYALNVSKVGYLFYSEHFSLMEAYKIEQPFIKNVALSPIELGEKIVLNNVFFEYNDYRLKPESLVELTKLKDFLEKNPRLKVEVSGHTDNTGDLEYNLELSEKRAKEVVSYLVESGLSVDRLLYKGYGDRFPIESNDTEEGRAANRRTEIKIIAY